MARAVADTLPPAAMRSATPNVGRTPVFSATASVAAAGSSRATTPCRGGGLYGDSAAAVGDHGRDRAFDAEEHAGRVDRNDPVPGFGVVKILFGAAGDAGIVDQHIELAEMSGGGGHDGGPVLLSGHVKRFEPCRGADAIGHLPAFVLQH